MAHTLFELDVRLREIEPPIWRTVEVPGSSSLEDVHFALQVAMGWTNSHLHQFKIGGKSYGMVDTDGADELELEDEREYRLDDLVRSGGWFVYEYDFGDGWEHHVKVKKVTKVARPPEPRCTAGARACPPEDCGGGGGYQNLLEALADPKHEEHESLVAWSGGFQPERFKLPKTGLDLRDEIENLRALAGGDDPSDPDDLDAADEAMLGLPKPLIDAVLALDPMQRASLGALIGGSLANELLEVRRAADQLAAGALKRDKKGARAPRKRARS
jgi:hypothetical protein